MTNIVWQNTQIPGFGGALNAANKSVSNFNSIVDNFKQGQLDKADRKIAAEDRAFKRKDDLLQRDLTNQQIAQGEYDFGNRDSDREMELALHNMSLKKGDAAINASNASNRRNIFGLKTDEYNQEQVLKDKQLTKQAQQLVSDSGQVGPDGKIRYDSNRIMGMPGVTPELIPYLTNAQKERQAADDPYGTKAVAEALKSTVAEEDRKFTKDIALEREKRATWIQREQEKNKGKTGGYSSGGGKKGSKFKTPMGFTNLEGKYTTGGDYESPELATAALTSKIQNAFPKGISNADTQRMIDDVANKYALEEGQGWWNTGFDMEKMNKYLPAAYQEHTLRQAARNKNKNK